MPTYHHKCEECGPLIVETSTIAEYMAYEEEFGRGEDTGNYRVPCPGCGGWAERDYSQGVAAAIVKGGHKYTTHQYRKGAEENWLRNEVQNTKSVLKYETGTNPYARFTCDPADVGARRVSDSEAIAKSESAKKALGETKDKITKAIKNIST